MKTAVDNLKEWFDNLDRANQEEVLKFLYEGRILIRKDAFFGPYPGFVTKGLHCGPAPLASSLSPSIRPVCPACGRPM